MTTEYCPITRRLITSLRKMDRVRRLCPDLDDQLDAIELRTGTMPTDPKHVRLRGFIIIEGMTAYIDEEYNKRYKATHAGKCPMRPSARTWGCLTGAMEQIVHVVDQLELDITEGQFEGVQYVGNTCITVGAQSGLDVQRSHKARTLQYLCKVTVNAIRTLRPYLRNPKSPVSALGDQTLDFYREIYGSYGSDQLLDVLNKIVEAHHE